MSVVSLSNSWQTVVSASNQAYSGGGGGGSTSSTGGTAFRNKVINGDMRIDQRNAGAAVNIVSDDIYYGPDRMLCSVNTYTGNPSYTLQQQTLSVTDSGTLGGITNSVRLTSTNGNTILNNYGSVGLQYLMEGYNITDLNWGFSGAQYASLSLWMKTNVTGVHSVALTNNSCANSYVASFNISSADTWSNVKLTIPAPPTGSVWETTSNVGIRFDIDATNQGYTTTYSNAWYNGFAITPSSNNSALWLGSNNYVEVTGIQFESTSNVTPFENRPLPLELSLCQRYYEKSFPYNVAPQNSNASVAPGDTMYFNNLYGMGYVTFKNPKKTTPSMVLYNPSSATGNIRTSAATDLTALASRTTQSGTSLSTTDSNLNSKLGYFNWTAESEYKKYDPNPSMGKVSWVANICGSADESSQCVCPTSDGGVAVGGGFQSPTLTAYNASGVAFGTTLTNTSANTWDVFVLKYSNVGTIQWIARISGSGAYNDYSAGICSTSDGGIVVGGYYNATTLTAYHATGTAFGTTIANSDATAASYDGFLVKYSISGVVQWVTKLYGSGIQTDQINYICSTNDGGIVAVGHFQSSTLTAYNAAGTAFGTTLTNTSAGGVSDAFIVKYNNAGMVQWISAIKGANGESGSKVASSSDGSIIVQGTFQSPTVTAYHANGTAFGTTLTNTISTVYSHTFIIKYNSVGSVQLFTSLMSAYNEVAGGICITSDGGFAITGYFNSPTMTAYHASGIAFGTTLTNSSTNYNDPYIIKYDSSGNVMWVTKCGGTASRSDNGSGICSTSDGGVVVTGVYTSTMLTAYHATGVAFGTTLVNTASSLNDSFILKISSSGVVQWFASIGGNAVKNETVNGVCYTSDNSIVLCGVYNSPTLMFYNASGSMFGVSLNNTDITGASGDAFIAKYTDTAAPLTMPLAQNRWVAQIAGSGNEYVQGLASDASSGNIASVGYYTSSPMTVYNADATAFGTTLANAGSNDAFVTVYNSSGVVQWVARLVGTSAENATCVKVATDGSIIVGGSYTSNPMTAYNANGTAFGTTLSYSGTNNDSFLAKYSSSGTVQWIAKIAGAAQETITSLTLDSSNNICVVGFYASAPSTAYNASGTAFGTTISNPLYGTSTQSFIAKYDISGNVLFYTKIGGSSGLDAYINGITTTSDNGFAITGSCSGSALTLYNADGSAFGTTFATSGSNDTFVAKYNNSGVAQWIARIGESTGSDWASGICCLADGGIVVTGYWPAGALLLYNADGTTFGTALASPQNNDVFIAKYNSAGVVQWGAKLGGAGITGHDYGYALCAMADGGFAVAGYYASNPLTAYSADGNAFSTTLANSGSNDAFIAKYNSSGYVQCVANFSGSSDDQAVALASCPDGDVVVGGTFTSASLGLQGASRALTLVGGNDGYVAKYGLKGAPLPLTSGTVQWVARLGGSGSDLGYSVTSTSDGGVVVIGNYASSPLTAYHANGTAFGTTFATAGGSDVFVAKYTSSGTVLWVAHLGGTLADAGNAVTSTSDGGIVVIGNFNSNPFTSYHANGTAFSSIGNWGVSTGDVFVIKYTSSGTVLWIATVAGTGYDFGYGVTSTSDGGIVVTGNYLSNPLTAYHANGTAFGTTLANAGGNDAFVAKYTSSGTVSWVARIAGTSTDSGIAVTSTSDGGILVVGNHISTTLTAYHADGTAFGTTLANYTGTDALIAKYTSSGTVSWVAVVAGTGNDYSNAVTSTSDGGIVVAGYYSTNNGLTAYHANGTAFGTTLPNAGINNDVFIAKYTSSGTVSWVAALGGLGSYNSSGVTSTSDGGIVVTGYFNSNPLTAYHANGTAFGTTLPFAGGSDVFVAKYTSSGTVSWVARIAGTSTDSCNAVTSTSDGGIVVTGYYTSNPLTTYHANGTAFGTTLPNAGSNDVFIVKYSQ